MLELIQKLFDLAQCPSSNIKIHHEKRTDNCCEIQSIGIVVRTVKVEFVRFVFNAKLNYLGIIHVSEGSAIFHRNGEVCAEDLEVGNVLSSLIAGELAAIVNAAEDLVFDAIAEELVNAEAIRPVCTRLTEVIADGFVVQSTAGTHTSAEQFLTDALKVKNEQ